MPSSLFTTSFTVAPASTNCSGNTHTFISLLTRSYRTIQMTKVRT